MLSTVNNLVPGLDKRAQARTTGSFDKPVCILTDGVQGLALASVLSNRCSALSMVNLVAAAEASDSCAVSYRDEAANYFDSIAKLQSLVVQASPDLAYCEYVLYAGSIRSLLRNIDFIRRNLRDGQNLILIDAPFGAGLQLVESLRRGGLNWNLNIAEVGNIFSTIWADADSLIIESIRTCSNIAGNTRNQLRKTIQMGNLLPLELIPASNVLERGLLEIERVLRPVLLLFGLLRATPADYLNNGMGLAESAMNETTMCLLDKLERELALIAKAYKTVAPAFGAIATAEQDPADENLFATWYSVLLKSFKGISDAKRSIVRDLTEHVCIITELARLAQLSTPTLESVVDLSSAVTDVDIRRHARNLHSLGLSGYEVADIIELVNA